MSIDSCIKISKYNTLIIKLNTVYFIREDVGQL